MLRRSASGPPKIWNSVFNAPSSGAAKGHGPITLHTFLQSFFSFSSPTAGKIGPATPARASAHSTFSYRLPFLRKWLTLYTDSEAHDEVSPIDAPRRSAGGPASISPTCPACPKLDMRAEAVYTDPPPQQPGRTFHVLGIVQRQGYTNNGQLFGDWIGREDKGGQGWITYHLSGNEWIQVGVRNQKAAKDFIPGGTTLNDIDFQAVKRIGKDFEINGNFAYEHWKAPVYPTGTPIYPATQQHNDHNDSAHVVPEEQAQLLRWFTAFRIRLPLFGKDLCEGGQRGFQRSGSNDTCAFYKTGFVDDAYLIEQNETLFAAVPDWDAEWRWVAAGGHRSNDCCTQVIVHLRR